MKFNDLIHEPWREVFNKNAKWSISLLFRGITIILSVSLLLGLLQWLGFIDLKSHTTEDSTIVIQKGDTVNISKPGVTDYKPTVKDLDSLIIMLKSKKAEISKNESNKKN